MNRHHAAGIHPLAPDEVGTPDLWLDASTLGLGDEASVTTWTDLAGNHTPANNGLTAPKYDHNAAPSGLQGVRFGDAGETGFTLASDYIFSTSGGLSVFAVAKCTTDGELQHILDFGKISLAGYGLNVAAGNLGGLHALNTAGGAYLNCGAIASGSIFVLCGTVDFSGEMRLFNGTQFVSADTTATQLTAAEIAESSTRQLQTGPVCIGVQAKKDSAAGRQFTGHVFEIGVYKSALSMFESAALINHLRQKWGA